MRYIPDVTARNTIEQLQPSHQISLIKLSIDYKAPNLSHQISVHSNPLTKSHSQNWGFFINQLENWTVIHIWLCH
jgi:hypothetical protein